MSNRNFNAVLASAFTAALALASVPALADDGATKEKCYGIATAGHNDCASAANNSCAGTAKANYENGAWLFVPKGTCLTTAVTLKNGTKRNGSLEPVKG
ncbi:MAG: DUF2282 domain-containing protein [Rhodomicrobium sp.]